jgi:peptide deformylase
MAIRQIFKNDAECLYKKCRPVERFDKKLSDLIDDMADTMYEANGVGLAAPQVGILKRAVVIDIGEGLVELLNPVILETSGSQTDEEGCLSLPGQSAPVERPYYVKAKAMDREGNEFIIEGEELMARALCHEIDHLDGILYIDKALPREEA